MNRPDLLALAERSLTTDVVTAGRAFGMGRTQAYELASRDAFPVPVLHLGSRLRVRTADLVAALDPTQSVSGAPRQESAAEISASTTTPIGPIMPPTAPQDREPKKPRVTRQCTECCPAHDLCCTHPPHRTGWHFCPEVPYGHRFYAGEAA
jgi:hypothetical protein